MTGASRSGPASGLSLLGIHVIADAIDIDEAQYWLDLAENVNREVTTVWTGTLASVRPEVRNTERATVTPADLRRLSDLITNLVDQFGPGPPGEYTLGEAPQLLVYGPGSEFIAHSDTSPDSPDPKIRRRVLTMVLLMSDPSDYEGGQLAVAPFSENPPPPGLVLPLTGRSLIIFPADRMHQVFPIVRGRRVVAVTWLTRVQDPT